MLDARGVAYEYREYTRDPLTRAELETLFERLELSPRDLLRKKDKAFAELGLSGNESDATLIRHMATHPTLLQRPIGVLGDRAVVGRPVENLLALLG